jgi:ABC-type transport system involved in multi-copper enzyme maturation permease subunit
MNATIAAQMTGADFLKLRKKRGTLIWATVLAVAPLIIFFIVAAAQHSSAPAEHPPAGGLQGFKDGMRIVALVFGPLAAILIGTDGGAADATSGVFRDLVVTGRSRVALFASRVPAALALTWLVVGLGYVLMVIGIYTFAAGSPTPSVSMLLDGLGFTALSAGVICAIAVGFASLTASRPAALTVLIGWQLVASPILANISSLGSSRKLVLSQAVIHFLPAGVTDHGGGNVSMSEGFALVVMLVWLVVFLALGAWRTRTMDA